MSRRTRGLTLLLILVVCSFQNGCLQAPTPVASENYNEEVRFRTAWDQGLGRLHYDEVVWAWGPATSVSHQGNNVLAQWHWNHTLRLPENPEPAVTAPADSAAGSFGERMELTFDSKTKLLKDWKHFQWGPYSAIQQHREFRSVELPPIRY